MHTYQVSEPPKRPYLSQENLVQVSTIKRGSLQWYIKIVCATMNNNIQLPGSKKFIFYWSSACIGRQLNEPVPVSYQKLLEKKGAITFFKSNLIRVSSTYMSRGDNFAPLHQVKVNSTTFANQISMCHGVIIYFYLQLFQVSTVVVTVWNNCQISQSFLFI